MVIPEENKAYREIIGNSEAPYLNTLAARYGSATRMDAGYPPRCPSLAAYIIMTSGSDHGICDDDDAEKHRLTGANIFQQVADAGREWRTYAESMPGNCVRTNSADERYVPRHAPAPYYVTEESRCQQWDQPMGTAGDGAFTRDLTAGALPAYSFVTPDNCHNMHGAPACQDNLIAAGDSWLADWMPRILASPDYTAGRLAIFITWDEGTRLSNHIPTLVVSPSTTRIAGNGAYTHCSALRTAEEILGLPLIGCARTAASMRREFRL